MNTQNSTQGAKQSTATHTARFINYLASPLPGQDISVYEGLLSGFESETLDHLMNDMIVNITINGGSEPAQEIAFLRDELNGVIHNLDSLLEGFGTFGVSRKETADPEGEVDFIEEGGKPTAESDFISEDDDTGVGAPPNGVMSEVA